MWLRVLKCWYTFEGEKENSVGIKFNKLNFEAMKLLWAVQLPSANSSDIKVFLFSLRSDPALSLLLGPQGFAVVQH